MTVTPVKAYADAAMTIDGKNVASKTVTLANGKSATVKIKLTVGKTSKTYTLTVKRAKSTDNTLKSITATAGTWSKAFDPAVTSYTLTLPSYKSSVTLNWKMADRNAQVYVNGIRRWNWRVALEKGQSKTINIVVKAQSGDTKTYTVTVTRR